MNNTTIQRIGEECVLLFSIDVFRGWMMNLFEEGATATVYYDVILIFAWWYI